MFLGLAETIFTNALKSLIQIYAPSVDPEAVIPAGVTGFWNTISGKDLADVLVAYAKEEPGFESLGWKSKGAHDYATFGSHPRAIDGFA